MGGISSGGLISGIDTQALINSLIQVAARPRTLAQNRLLQLQSQQAAYLDLNTQLGSLRSAASAFRSQNVFRSKLATSSNDDVLSATASIGAQPGSYSFIVDRLVSSQQMLSRGFQDRDTSAIGAESFTFESILGRVDRDLSLNALNDGEGVTRGKIRINDGSTIAEVDLSRVGTVGEVLDAINSSGLDVTARVRDGRFEIVGATTVTNAGTADVAGSLGLTSDAGAADVSGVWTGARVYELTGSVALTALNDGNGVSYRSLASEPNGVATDFQIVVGGVNVNVGLGAIRASNDGGTPGDTSDDTIDIVEPPVSTIQGLLDRINDAFTNAGVTATASIDAASGSLVFNSSSGNITAINAVNNSNAARDLGLDSIDFSSPTTTAQGSRIFAGMGTVLLNNLNGGAGLSGSGVLGIQARNGDAIQIGVDLDNATTLEEVIDAINNDVDNAIGGDPLNGPAIRVSLNSTGNGLRIEDLTGGSGNLVVQTFSGDDIAGALGLDTGATGIEDDAFTGTSLQRRYISEGTRLSSLRNGEGIGTGRFRLVDASGASTEVNIGEDLETVGELLSQIRSAISSSALDLEAAINDQGDGIIIRDTSGSGNAISIEDTEGLVASNLRIAGEASGVGADNFIDGSFETTVEFDPNDTLDDIVSAINNAEAGVAVSILNDGSGTRPFRLSLTSRDSGVAGRFILDTNGFDLGLSTLDRGEDARVIFGSSDPATGVLLTNSTNTLDNVVTGLTIDLTGTSDDPVTVSVTNDTGGVESAINSFIESYNAILNSIERSTRFDPDTGDRGALLGDGLLLGLRGGLFSAIQSPNEGFTSTYNRLSQVGVSIGSEGRLEFDREQFREALATDPDAVADLFTRRVLSDDNSTSEDLPDGITATDPNARDRYDELGVIGQLEEFAINYVDSIDGILTNRTNALDSQILNQQRRIDSLTEGLSRERARLEAQFVAMEQALAQLQSQQSALASLGVIG